MRAPKLLFFILANLYRGSTMYIIVDMRPQTTNRYSILCIPRRLDRNQKLETVIKSKVPKVSFGRQSKAKRRLWKPWSKVCTEETTTFRILTSLGI